MQVSGKAFGDLPSRSIDGWLRCFAFRLFVCLFVCLFVLVCSVMVVVDSVVD